MGGLKKKADIVRVNRNFPVLQDDNLGEDPEVIDVEVVPVKEEPPSNTDYFKRWMALFLTTALFWAVIFTAAWLNHIIGG